ncbi:hypothetical protein MY11210_005944 [Beauveria gryllotalpidicola]
MPDRLDQVLPPSLFNKCEFISVGATGWVFKVAPGIALKYLCTGRLDEFCRENETYELIERSSPPPHFIQSFLRLPYAHFMQFMPDCLDLRLRNNRRQDPKTLKCFEVLRLEPTAKIKQWAVELSSALAWLESLGLVQGDLRPSNILLDSDNHDHLKLVDFDSCAKISDVDPGLPPPWSSPKHQFYGAGTEQFAFGSILYNMTRGLEPYEDKGPEVITLFRTMVFPELSDSRRKDMSITDVLIVGAGPTGLALAIWLTKLGVAVRIIDEASTIATTTRALAVQARTLELYSQVGLGEAVSARSAHVTGPNLWAGGAHRARLCFADVAVGLTAYPFIAILSQNEHEQLLIDRLCSLGVAVERGTGLESFVEDVEAASVRAVLQKDNGEKEICEARYVAGCDGAHSAVRRIIGMGFPGDTYEQVFYVADIEATGPAMNGELHLCVDNHDFLGIIPLAGKQCARLIGIVTPPSESSPASTTSHASTFEHVRGRAVDEMKLENIHVNWFTTYRTHHRVADHFRKGRAFLLGDAAHIHSPAGGQGMNTGIGDAINLAWKIAAVLDNHAQDSLLDTYEEERSRFARKLVDTTDRAFAFMTKRGWLAGLIRSTFVAYVMPILFCFRAIRYRAFCGLSQFVLNYTGTALAGGSAARGAVQAGERVPWVNIGGQDNHESLQHMEWQLHVYGTASEQLIVWCKTNGMRLTVLDWAAEHGSAGFIRDAAYLLRPDTYVALIDAEADANNIEQYFSERQICLSSN